MKEHPAASRLAGDTTDDSSRPLDVLDPDQVDARADPTWRWPTERSGGLAILFVVSAGFYAVGLLLALELIDASGLSSVFFIPAGITVGFLLRLPRHTWWVVLVAVAVVETSMDLAAGYSAAATAGFVTANVAEPLVAATLVSRFCGPLDLARIRHVLVYLFSAVLVAPGIAALIGSAPSAVLSGDDFGTRFWQWWLGDALGVLLVGTAILAWGSSPDRRPLRSAFGITQLVGSLLLTIGVLAAGLPMMFLVLIGVVVAGAVFGIRAVAATALVVATTVAVGLAFGVGLPYAVSGEATALVLVKLQLGLFTLAGFVVAAEAYEGALARETAAMAAGWVAISERERATERQTAIRLQEALLPPAPVRDSRFEVAARYLPGAGNLLVGGDWHNLFRCLRVASGSPWAMSSATAWRPLRPWDGSVPPWSSSPALRRVRGRCCRTSIGMSWRRDRISPPRSTASSMRNQVLSAMPPQGTLPCWSCRQQERRGGSTTPSPHRCTEQDLTAARSRRPRWAAEICSLPIRMA